MKFIAAILAVALAGLVMQGCAPTGGATNPENDLYAAKQALTTADTVALKYTTLPLCGPTHAKPMCSEAAVTAKIKAAGQAAHDALDDAGRNLSKLPAAKAAIATLENTTPK